MKKYQLTLLSLCVAAFAQAKVTLPSFFTDNMVIQQNSRLTLPGKAKAGKQVTVKVSWNNEKYTTQAAADGHFTIEVPTPSAGGPYQITVSDGEKLVLNNVLSGEVWICSGQSNMDMPVAGWGKVMNYEQEVADADYPSIRLLQVKKTVAFSPQENVEMNMNGWQECSSATVPEFSSVAYFYARKLWKELNIPVGVIDCTWGGTPAESWTSHQTLKQVMGFQKKMAEMESAGFRREKLVELYHREMDEWLQQFDAKDPGLKDGTPQWISALQTGNEWKPMELPAYWETRGLQGGRRQCLRLRRRFDPRLQRLNGSDGRRRTDGDHRARNRARSPRRHKTCDEKRLPGIRGPQCCRGCGRKQAGQAERLAAGRIGDGLH